MKLISEDLDKITDLTLDYYNRHAEDFWEGTRNHDVRTSRRCCKTSRVNGFLRYSILAVGPDATLRPLPNSATSQQVWKAPPTSRPWRAPIAAAKYGNRISHIGSTRQLFRWRIRQPLAVSCSHPGIAARVARAVCMSKAGRRVVQLKPARS